MHIRAIINNQKIPYASKHRMSNIKIILYLIIKYFFVLLISVVLFLTYLHMLNEIFLINAHIHINKAIENNPIKNLIILLPP